MLYVKYIKRALDFLVSCVGIIALCPLFVAIAIWIKIDSSGPIVFKQTRIGRGKKHFAILKFRTMFVDAPHDMPTHMLEQADSYITRSGKFLRRTSLDELPQVLNILKGDMSIIGPRPALWNQDDLIAERDKYKGINGWTPNDLRPGLTGWAQINGRDELKIPVKAKFDGEYVDKMSFVFDMKCFFQTITSIVQHKGIVEGRSTANHIDTNQDTVE